MKSSKWSYDIECLLLNFGQVAPPNDELAISALSAKLEDGDAWVRRAAVSAVGTVAKRGDCRVIAVINNSNDLIYQTSLMFNNVINNFNINDTSLYYFIINSSYI